MVVFAVSSCLLFDFSVFGIKSEVLFVIDTVPLFQILKSQNIVSLYFSVYLEYFYAAKEAILGSRLKGAPRSFSRMHSPAILLDSLDVATVSSICFLAYHLAYGLYAVAVFSRYRLGVRVRHTSTSL